MRSPRQRFRQADLTRAVRGATKGGIRVGRIEIEPSGKIVITSETVAPANAAGSWDEVLK